MKFQAKIFVGMFLLLISAVRFAKAELRPTEVARLTEYLNKFRRNSYTTHGKMAYFISKGELHGINLVEGECLKNGIDLPDGPETKVFTTRNFVLAKYRTRWRLLSRQDLGRRVDEGFRDEHFVPENTYQKNPGLDHSPLNVISFEEFHSYLRIKAIDAMGTYINRKVGI